LDHDESEINYDSSTHFGRSWRVVQQAGLQRHQHARCRDARRGDEVTIYRYYSCKRELFMAALESEMVQLTIHADSITAFTQAADARTAVSSLFEMIRGLVSRHPRLVRLIQFSALEMSDGLEPLCKKHLAGLLEASAMYLKRWVESGELNASDPKLTVLAFVATVVGVDSFYPLMWGPLAETSRDAQVGGCVELWSAVLTPNSVS
jgi:AcrR family transcriptional regulator